jgi:hypothetical protein
VSMKGVERVRITILLVIAFTILFISFYESTKNQQRNNEQNVQNPTETILAVPTGSPTDGYASPKPIRQENRDNPSNEEIYEEIQKIFITQEAINWAKFIAYCESTLNPYAIGSGKYYGLFQYLPSTYKNCGGTDIYDWREQIMITKNCMFDHGRQNEFPACNRRYQSQ